MVKPNAGNSGDENQQISRHSSSTCSIISSYDT